MPVNERQLPDAEKQRLLGMVKVDLGGPRIMLPLSKYREHNRQEMIRVDNEGDFSGGWLPKGGVGWWRFRLLTTHRQEA